MGNDWASLHKACRENNEAVIREHSGLAGSSDYNEETCYHSAAFSGARTTCELLYELGGLNVNHPNNFFTFPSQIACYRDNVEVLRWLVEKDPACLDVLVRKREVGGTFFYGQYVDGKYDYGSLCVKQFGHKLIRDSLLHICIRVKATKCIAFLLSLPSVQPHALNHFGDTPRDVDSFLFDGIVQIAQEGQMLQSNRTVQSNTVVWKPDASASLCRVCLSQFNLFNRRHHCRICGAVVCDECSPHQGEGSIMPGMPLEVCARIEAKELQRLCSRCQPREVERLLKTQHEISVHGLGHHVLQESNGLLNSRSNQNLGFHAARDSATDAKIALALSSALPSPECRLSSLDVV